jgi:hypothetical protein
MFPILRKFYLYASLVVVGIIVAACGTEQLAGGGIGGTGITSGTITGFGSVFVNGVEFDTSGATRTVDDVITVSNGSDDSTVLGQGMVVSITGKVNADGITGTATSIDYDEIIEGPIGNIPVEDADMITKTFDVLGVPVKVDRNGTVFVDTDYQSIGMDDIVEISGFFDSAGNLLATHVDKEGVLGGGSTVELHGMVSGFNGMNAFTLGALTVTFTGMTVFEDLPGTVSDGQFVEVSGTLTGATSVIATRIELEDDVSGFTGPISLEGVVSRFNGTGDFSVGGQQVDASAAVFSPSTLATTIGNDDRVEAEGSLAGGVLTAATVEARSGSLKLSGIVTFVDTVNGMVSIEVVSGQPVVTVNVDATTQLEDELGSQPFTLNDLSAGNEVIVEGILESGNVVNASKLKRDILDKHVLQGPVDAAAGDSTSGSITILGVVFMTDGSTDFEDMNDQAFPNGGDDFYAQVVQGSLVELEDKKPVDGIADEVELKN